MANSNKRDKNSETVHHLVSRIAHRVYFLKEDERMDFLDIVRRAAEFTGVELLGWCVMTNHFHLLVYLPAPPIVDEDEVLRRYGILKGAKATDDMVVRFESWRRNGDSGERLVAGWVDRQRRRMYDVGCFMKIVKQWFTEEYNRRNAHKGTLWESAYFDRIVPRSEDEMAKCLGYIHLNPIRSADTDRFDGYAWSSYSAFRKGDPTAIRGMRFIYGMGESESEIAYRHEALLEGLLETEKLRRAEEIARKRALGYEVPVDPLTTEAMVAQRAAHLAEVQKALIEYRDGPLPGKGNVDKKELREKEILTMLAMCPGMDAPQLAERLSIGMSTAYRLLSMMKRKGLVHQERRGGFWKLSK